MFYLTLIHKNLSKNLKKKNFSYRKKVRLIIFSKENKNKSKEHQLVNKKYNFEYKKKIQSAKTQFYSDVKYKLKINNSIPLFRTTIQIKQLA